MGWGSLESLIWRSESNNNNINRNQIRNESRNRRNNLRNEVENRPGKFVIDKRQELFFTRSKFDIISRFESYDGGLTSRYENDDGYLTNQTFTYYTLSALWEKIFWVNAERIWKYNTPKHMENFNACIIEGMESGEIPSSIPKWTSISVYRYMNDLAILRIWKKKIWFSLVKDVGIIDYKTIEEIAIMNGLLK